MEDSRERTESMARCNATRLLSREFTCYVKQRDDICYLIKFQEDAKGEDVMDEICHKLGIVEKDYFGLQYVNGRGEVYWLNMRNRVSKQLNKQEPHLLFCVKFYVQPHQLLQQSSRQQFFLNVKHEILNGRYKTNIGVMARLYALIAQVEAGCFKENHVSYNPSRVTTWSPEFRDQVILEHCKLKEMSAEVAEFFCLKEVAELDDYGMEYCNVRTEDNNSSVLFGIGIDCLQIEHSDNIQRVPYSCLRMAINSGKTVKLDIYATDGGETETVVYRLNSKEAACSLYRSITEHHAFYKCDSVRPAVKEQVSRDFFDNFLSWFHDNGTTQNYIFDTERTCREAYDHARRTLYNFGSSVATNFSAQNKMSPYSESPSENDNFALEGKVNQLTEDLRSLEEAFYCPVCRDAVVDIVLQCGHLICGECGSICEECPFCRTPIQTKTKIYMPATIIQDANNKQKLVLQSQNSIEQKEDCIV